MSYITKLIRCILMNRSRRSIKPEKGKNNVILFKALGQKCYFYDQNSIRIRNTNAENPIFRMHRLHNEELLKICRQS